MTVFLDASALIALGNPSDGNHLRAKRCMSDLRRRTLVTSDYVLDEVLTRCLTTRRTLQGLELVGILLADPRVTLDFVDRGVFDQALERASKFRDQLLSFTDITNTIFVDRHNAESIFTFDGGFESVGYRVIPHRRGE